MANLSAKTYSLLKENNQMQLANFANELNTEQAAILEKQINEIDWREINQLIKDYVLEKKQIPLPQNIEPAPYYPYPTKDQNLLKKYSKANDFGAELIRRGKVALLTVAGGQGTRLGFDGPKGTYPITPITAKTFFQYFAEKIQGAQRKYNSELKWLIMTSPANDTATKNFFQKNNFFGLKNENIHFFVQGTMPVFSYDGKILMESKFSLALSPNGHGGAIQALRKASLLDFLSEKGIEFVSYFQIDNLIVPILDTLFIGLHALEGSEVSSRMLAKTGPFEKLGNFCISNGKLYIIEYSDFPEELATKRDKNGTLLFISGSPAIHIFSVNFLKKISDPKTNLKLPWHRADKKVSFINENGDLIKPEKNNAVKLETFIFDTLPLAEKTIIFEGLRDEIFSPTKNPTGVDSVESARNMLSEKDARLLEKAGIKCPRKDNGSLDCIIELNPSKYYDLEDIINYESEIYEPKRGEKNLYS